MRCIYTVFYNNLKNYDGKNTNIEYRRKLLQYCLESYRRNNVGIEVIIDYVDDEIQNTADMYFDKMRRIKELNYLYDVLWVDGDTICLDNIEEIFKDKMCAIFWGWWDSFNLINGGVVYYPKRFLFNRWDKFVTDWINLLSGLHESGKKFNGPMEQIPITNLLLRQINDMYDYKSYSIFENFEYLLKSGVLLHNKFNYNYYIHRYYDTTKYLDEYNTVYDKKILHCNISEHIGCVNMIEYMFNNIIDVINDCDKLLKRGIELGINNARLIIETLANENFRIKNPTKGIYKIFAYDDDYLYTDRSVHFILNENQYCDIKCKSNFLIKNLYTGEQTIHKNINNL